MDFLAFFQENILLFALAIAVLGALITLEVRGLKTRGADLTTSGLSQAVNRDALLIDLRPHEDFRAGHIAGAKSIPFDELDNHLNSLGEKDRDIVMYCKIAGTSGKAVAKLRKLGYSNVKHLKGGIAEWNNENLPLTKKG